MKLILFIIGTILSCISSNRMSVYEKIQDVSQSSIVRSENQNTGTRDCDSKSFGILPSSSFGYSGENNNISPSVRSTNSGRQVQHSFKSPSRIIKDGKVIDKHSFNTYITDLKQFQSGIHSTGLYVHFLCKLLI